jgi:D-alanyl-lipoteichoic acid acyltransferase DltB (MBOAT superfamily)
LLFTSWVFWLFLPLVLGGYFLLRRQLRAQNLFLLLASLVFYGWWDWRFLGLLVLSSAVDYIAALYLDRRRAGTGEYALSPRTRKRLLAASMIANLGILAFFKYFNFFEENLVESLSWLLGYPVDSTGLEIVLPVGISFFTFQSMSYTIDVYRGELRATRHWIEYGTFVAFFPQLVAGPIVRARDYLPQIEKRRRFDARRFNEGGYLILWGMFKKVVIADNLAPVVDKVFAADPASLGGATVVLATYAFAFQIYCDFSGYTDIARGCAKLMGFEFHLNFNLPYAARTPSEFWKRWHISLSTWLRDYLYIPLGGNRARSARVYVNLMVTMVLGGLWHGASWTFVVWGFYQGALLVIWRFATPRLAAIPALARLHELRVVRFVEWAVFFHLVCLGWLIFRAQSFGQIVDMLSAIAGGLHGRGALDLAWRLIFFTWPLVLMQIVQHRTGRLDVVLGLAAPVRGAIYAAWLIGIVVFGQFHGNEFIYFQF